MLESSSVFQQNCKYTQKINKKMKYSSESYIDEEVLSKYTSDEQQHMIYYTV